MSHTATRWNSRISFIFAASAAAIGLGNIWRFPYMAGQNGGGVFVLIYLGCVLALGIPLLISEVVLGRMGRGNPVQALITVARKSKRSKWWGWLGGLTVLTAFLILSYYVVIVGWVLDYFVRAITGQFAHVTEASSQHAFTLLQSSHWQMLLTDSSIILGAVAIIIFGIKAGLERAVLFFFPALLVLLLVLLGYALTTDGFAHAIDFLFKPDWQEVTGKTVLLALGQAFFSLNIAMAVTLLFSAYLPDKTPIISSSIAVVIADTLFAILAGLIIFPIVFSFHLQADAGPSLIFKTLPIAFGQLPYGSVIASIFFLLLLFAAFTSVIALFEPAVVWLMDSLDFGRKKAVWVSALTCWILSLGTIGSFSFGEQLQLFGHTFYQDLDFVTAGIMLPVGGLLIAIFTGWLISKQLFQTELNWSTEGLLFRGWRFILRYFAPIAILLILFSSLGLFA